jgi:hypothetical protein
VAALDALTKGKFLFFLSNPAGLNHAQETMGNPLALSLPLLGADENAFVY